MDSKPNKNLPLADRPEPLQHHDVQCPICFSVLIEPVAIPCGHRFCLTCFKKQLAETSLHCPCCRMRLSVWSRNAFRENNMVDKKLWDRIQKEFPKLVETRLLGEDSQELDPEDFMSVLLDKNENDFGDGTDSEEDDKGKLSKSGSKSVRQDGMKGIACNNMRFELENSKCQEDIENRRLADLKVKDELGNIKTDPEFDLEESLTISTCTKRRLFQNQPAACKTSPKSQTPGRVKIAESSLTTSTVSERTYCETPKSTGKRPSLSSLSSRSAKRLKNGKVNHRIETVTSASFQSQGQGSDIEGESDQNQNQDSLSPEKSPNDPSSAEDNKSEIFYPSAFSPTRKSRSKVIPGALHYHHQSISILKPMNRCVEQVEPANNSERDIPTPNSIDLEVNSHFRPILSAPKTPPKRLPDGTYLPEPVIVKTTPVKLLHTEQSDIDIIDMTQVTQDSQDSQRDRNSSGQIIQNIPSRDQDGQRISDDSGTVCSATSVSASTSNSGSIDFSSDSDDYLEVVATVAGKKGQMAEADPPAHLPTPHLSRLRPRRKQELPATMTTMPLLTQEQEEDNTSPYKGNLRPPTISIYESMSSTSGSCSPSSASDLQRQRKVTKTNSDDEEDIAWLIEEGNKSPTSSQNSRRMDLEEINRQAEAFEKIRLKYLQEEADRQLAKKIQTQLRKQDALVQARAEPHCLRSSTRLKTRNSKK